MTSHAVASMQHLHGFQFQRNAVEVAESQDVAFIR
jgi:hypothetical protein